MLRLGNDKRGVEIMVRLTSCDSPGGATIASTASQDGDPIEFEAAVDIER